MAETTRYSLQTLADKLNVRRNHAFCDHAFREDAEGMYVKLSDYNVLTAERDALLAQLAAARELLIEAAIDIEAGVNATYHGPSNVHPALYHKYARDLEITARLMIAALITEAPTDATI